MKLILTLSALAAIVLAAPLPQGSYDGYGAPYLPHHPTLYTHSHATTLLPFTHFSLKGLMRTSPPSPSRIRLPLLVAMAAMVSTTPHPTHVPYPSANVRSSDVRANAGDYGTAPVPPVKNPPAPAGGYGSYGM
jgi:hypothetical protein